jgi:excisionase family DNA binding protein
MKPPNPVNTADPRRLTRLTAAQLLTAEQLAERWQVNRLHVYRLVREDRLPAVRIGRYVRFHLAVVEAWEQSGGCAVA